MCFVAFLIDFVVAFLDWLFFWFDSGCCCGCERAAED